MYQREFDIIVVGCGHAGCEAAHAGAKLGLKTLLVGINLDLLAWMPCNPAIGGPAKSQMVKEIDALGGLMGIVADETYIQLKTLNTSRGAAVHSLRAQSDKYAYSAMMRKVLQNTPNLFLYQAIVNKILLKEEKVIGIETAIGEQIGAKAVIITSGTFLGGKVFTGKRHIEGGRVSEPASIGLSYNLKEIGFNLRRLKTGTPARLDARTIDFSVLDKHEGDEIPKFFSFLPNRPVLQQMPCYITRTNQLTHKIILDNLMESPLYAGMIEGVGPRYCPSIEDKLVRFKDKDSHLFFLEPEGRNTNEIYLQGCSTSLPVNIQWQIVRSLKGLEKAEIVRPAYAIEYDFLPPSQFKYTLESKEVKGLFCAGQILGTSGYEEAAAQGLVAGINASRNILNLEPILFDRASSYIGTLINDLMTKDIIEPYRMLTSRSEYRLLLRQDNADRRLTPLGREIGLVDDYRWEVFNNKLNDFNRGMDSLQNTRIKNDENTNAILQEWGESPIKEGNSITLTDLLARPNINYKILKQIQKQNFDETLPYFEIETEIKYNGYVERQNFQVDRLKEQENKIIPTNFNYDNLTHLSTEAREKLKKFKPETLNQASRIDGVSNADMSLLLISLMSSKK